MDLNEMLVFTRVVQAGSFSAAARQLEMPKSTVSRKVAELEDRVGARLIQRTTRKLGLTDAGRIYFEHGARIAAELEEAERAVGNLQSEPRGLLRITAPLQFTSLGPIIAELLGRHPALEVELSCTDRRVDLVEEGFDAAIRAGALDDSTLVARSLGTIQRVLVAAPRYCKRNGTPKQPADLLRHATIAFGSGANPLLWTLISGNAREEVRITPRLTTNDFDVLAASIRAGVGIGWLPTFLCAAELRTKKLKRVLPEWSTDQAPVHAVYPTARHLSPKVNAFLELLRARFRLG
jgi:DNA-binding transcriptional LysR family regulator